MKKRTFLFGLIIIILLSIIFCLLVYINELSKPSKSEIIKAHVLAVGEDYLLVTDSDDVDYIVDTDDVSYDVNDYIEIDLSDMDEDVMPISGVAKKITLISKSKEDNSIDNNDISNDSENIVFDSVNDNDAEVVTDSFVSSSVIDNNGSIINSSNSSDNSTYTDDDVINYIKAVDNDLDGNINSSTKEKIKSKFVEIVDFIFYDGTIYGRTFSDLSSSAKLKIITIALSIDSKIDEKIPGYKDTVSEKYHDIKNKLIAKYLDITTSICSNNGELCENAKEGFKDLKSSFSVTWQMIKELAGNSVSKLKNWYEIWRYS